MNLDTLRLFCNVVRQQGFSRGARASGVSQSAASQAVAQLEGDLDVLLIDRSRRPMSLTREGRLYYEGVNRLLREYEDLTAGIRSARSQITGNVRIASIYSIGLYAMSRHAQRFQTQYPQAKVRLDYLRPDKVVEAVMKEEADLGLLSFPRANRFLSVIPLRTEKMVFVCRPGHRLASKPRIELSDLDGENFVAFDPDLAIRKAIDRALRKHRVQPRIVLEFDNIETIKQALAIGAGVSILPEPTVWREARLHTLVVVPFNALELVRPLGILHRRRKILSAAVRKFIELLRAPDEGPPGSA